MRMTRFTTFILFEKEAKLKHQLNRISELCLANNMAINLRKSMCITIASKSKVKVLVFKVLLYTIVHWDMLNMDKYLVLWLIKL